MKVGQEVLKEYNRNIDCLELLGGLDTYAIPQCLYDEYDKKIHARMFRENNPVSRVLYFIGVSLGNEIE